VIFVAAIPVLESNITVLHPFHDPALVVANTIPVVHVRGVEVVAAFVALVDNVLAARNAGLALAPRPARIFVDVGVVVLDDVVVYILITLSNAVALLHRGHVHVIEDPAVVVPNAISFGDVLRDEDVASLVALVHDALAASGPDDARAPVEAVLLGQVGVPVLHESMVHVGPIGSNAEAVLPRKVR